MEETEYKKFKDVWVRDGLQVDKDMVNQCLKNYKDFDNLNDTVVMDWGMNIGGFGSMVLKHPIRTYIGIEAHPENFKVAQKNLGHDPRAILINAAVTMEDEESIQLFLTESKQAFCSGTINVASRQAQGMRKVVINVPTVNASEIIEKYKPTHLKCDIEGEEYRILDKWGWKFPECIRQMALEFHHASKCLEYPETFRKDIINEGFEPVFENLSYVKGSNEINWLGEDILYRNIWGIDALYKRP